MLEQPSLKSLLFEMSYPTHFNMEEFKSLKTFAARKRYADEHLFRMASGSGRLVYKIDDQKVLKLAKNVKGQAQNQVEADGYLQRSYGDIIAKVLEVGPQRLWIESELAKKVTPNRFKALAGFSIGEFDSVIRHAYAIENPSRTYMTSEPAGYDEIIRSDLVDQVFSMMRGMGMSPRDFGRISSWGEISGRLILTDYGLTDDVYQTHYVPKRNDRYAY